MVTLKMEAFDGGGLDRSGNDGGGQMMVLT